MASDLLSMNTYREQILVRGAWKVMFSSRKQKVVKRY